MKYSSLWPLACCSLLGALFPPSAPVPAAQSGSRPSEVQDPTAPMLDPTPVDRTPAAQPSSPAAPAAAQRGALELRGLVVCGAGAALASLEVDGRRHLVRAGQVLALRDDWQLDVVRIDRDGVLLRDVASELERVVR
jgi:hypothetical protein